MPRGSPHPRDTHRDKDAPGERVMENTNLVPCTFSLLYGTALPILGSYSRLPNRLLGCPGSFLLNRYLPSPWPHARVHGHTCAGAERRVSADQRYHLTLDTPSPELMHTFSITFSKLSLLDWVYLEIRYPSHNHNTIGSPEVRSPLDTLSPELMRILASCYKTFPLDLVYLELRYPSHNHNAIGSALPQQKTNRGPGLTLGVVEPATWPVVQQSHTNATYFTILHL